MIRLSEIAEVPTRLDEIDSGSINPYSGLAAEDAISKSKTIYKLSTQYEVPLWKIEKLNQEAEAFNVENFLHQPIKSYTYSEDLNAPKKGLRQVKYTEDEIVDYNLQRLPDNPRIKEMANEYVRQRNIRLKAEEDKTADYSDVLDFNAYLAYFAGGIEMAESVMTANIVRNKPHLSVGSKDQLDYLKSNPEQSYIPSVWNTKLNDNRIEEVNKLSEMEQKARQQYYLSRGTIGVGEFYKNKKDVREYMLFSDILKALKNNELRQAINRVQDPELYYLPSEFTEHGLSPNYDKDLLLIRNHYFALEETITRGQTVVATLSDMGLDMVKYMGEIALLTGIGGEGTLKGTYKGLRKLGVPKIISRNAAKLSAASTMAVLNPSAITNLTIERMTDKGYIDDYGAFVKTDAGQAITEALPKSLAEQSVTYYIEMKGEDIVRGLSKVSSSLIKKMPKGLVSKLDDMANYMKEAKMSTFNKLPPKFQGAISELKTFFAKADPILKAGKFSGLLGENLEEYLDGVVKPILLLDDQYRDKDADYINRVATSLVPNPKEILMQSVLFTLVPVVSGAIANIPTGVRWAKNNIFYNSPDLPEVYNRIVFENNLMSEYGLDHQQSYEIADLFDSGANIDQIETKIKSYGGNLTDFSFDNYASEKALASMLIDRGLVPESAKRIAELTARKAQAENKTIQEAIQTEEFKRQVEEAPKTTPPATGEQLEESKTEKTVPKATEIDKQAENIAQEAATIKNKWAGKAKTGGKKENATQSTPKNAVGQTEAIPAEAAKEEKQPVETESITVDVIQPVQTLESFEGTGETKPRGLSEHIQAESIEKGLTDIFGDLPEYKVVKMKEQAQKIKEFIESDYNRAVSVAMGEENAPQGIIPEMTLAVLANIAVEKGDVNILRDLAVMSKLPETATTMGQRIRALGEISKDSPIAVIQNVEKAKKRNYQKRKGDLKEAQKKEVESIKEAIKKAKPDNGATLLAEFIKSLQC